MTSQAIESMKEHFHPSEWQRLEGTIERIMRDRDIKADFARMRSDDVRYDVAIRALAKEYHLSESHISDIVYPRKKKKRG